MENSARMFDQHIPKSVENSCLGASAEGAIAEGQLNENYQGNLAPPSDLHLSNNMEERKEIRSTAVVGGITCCVPQCFSTSLRNPELSLDVIPNGKNREKQALRKRWLYMISQQTFDAAKA